MSEYCLMGHNTRREDCRNGYNCPDFCDTERCSTGGVYIYEECLHLEKCDVCDKAHCKSYEMEYSMKVKGPGGGYVNCNAPNFCPNCGRYIGAKRKKTPT